MSYSIGTLAFDTRWRILAEFWACQHDRTLCDKRAPKSTKTTTARQMCATPWRPRHKNRIGSTRLNTRERRGKYWNLVETIIGEETNVSALLTYIGFCRERTCNRPRSEVFSDHERHVIVVLLHLRKFAPNFECPVCCR